MRRSSIELSELVEHISQAGQASCWLSALRILLAVEPDFLRADGPPHSLLQHIVTPRMEGDWGTGEWGIRFDDLLRERHFTGAQRQAILVAWALFNGGAQEAQRHARFDDICCRLDPANYQAVVDAMEIRRERSLAPEGVQPVFAEEVDQERRREQAIGRVLETLKSRLEAWRDAGF